VTLASDPPGDPLLVSVSNKLLQDTLHLTISGHVLTPFPIFFFFAQSLFSVDVAPVARFLERYEGRFSFLSVTSLALLFNQPSTTSPYIGGRPSNRTRSLLCFLSGRPFHPRTSIPVQRPSRQQSTHPRRKGFFPAVLFPLARFPFRTDICKKQARSRRHGLPPFFIPFFPG